MVDREVSLTDMRLAVGISGDLAILVHKESGDEATCASSDGIDFCVVGGSGFCGGDGGDTAGVVDTVCEEDDDAAFGVDIFESVDAHADGFADGGTVFDESWLKAIEVRF